MPFGTTVTSYVANLFPNDPIAPQVVGDFAQTLPPNPVRGQTMSHFAQDVLPPNPVHPADLGQQLSSFVQILVRPDVGFGDGLII